MYNCKTKILWLLRQKMRPPYIIKVDFCLLLKNIMQLSPGLLSRNACLDNVARFANAKLILFSNQLTKKPTEMFKAAQGGCLILNSLWVVYVSIMLF